jgi:hypothetical protein
VILIAILGPSLLKALERFHLRAHIDWQPLTESTSEVANKT